MNNSLPGLPEFEYIRPSSLKDAAGFLAEHPLDARPFSGGTDCFVRMRDRVWKLKYLVDIKHLDGAQELSFDPNRGLTIGAGVNMNRVVAMPEAQRYFPALVEAAGLVAGYQLRNRATIIGNICNASPGGDTLGACLVYQAVLNIHGPNGCRKETINGFFTGPGKTLLKSGEIVLSIELPIPPKGAKGKYLSIGRNALGDLAIVAVTVLGYPDASSKSGFQFRIVLSAVAPTPLVAEDAQRILSKKSITAESIQQAAELAMEASQPIDDIRGSKQYRREMVKELTQRALLAIWSQLKTGSEG
jgi:carbon-monoxide dehydrogenase medium subunit